MIRQRRADQDRKPGLLSNRLESGDEPVALEERPRAEAEQKQRSSHSDVFNGVTFSNVSAG